MTHLSIRFWILKTSDTLKGSPTKIIGTEKQKNFDRKPWLLPLHLLLFKNFFASRNFLRNRTEGFPNQFFLGTVTQKIWQKIMKLPPSPLFIQKPFPFGSFFSNTAQRGNATKSFGTAGHKFSTENCDTLSLSSALSYHKFFLIPEVNETLKDCPTKFFGTVRQKRLTENCETPSLPPHTSNSYNVSIPESLWNQDVFPYGVSRYCETRSFP